MLSKLLITIAKKHKDRMADYLRTMDLYVGQDIFLLVLARHGEMSQSALKEKLKVEYSTIHKIAARLEKRELIVKTIDPGDKRVSVIRLNPKGEEIAGKIEQYWKELDKEFFDPLNEEEQKQLHNLLQKLNN